MTKRLLYLANLTGLGLILITPAVAAASVIQGMASTVGCGILAASANLGTLVTFYICVLSRYATALGVILIMIAGLLYVLSGANPTYAGTAKNIVVTTLTGIIAMYSISFILEILTSTGIVHK